ncbi:MAG: M20 family metallopeptidase [Marinifilaceae bacterium]
MIESIKTLSKQINEEVKAIFTYLHQNPELSFKEYNTSLYITEFLKKEEIPFERVTETSIVAFIKGKSDKRTIALRSDMDALPICEDESHVISSKNDGIMHACGHDFHMSALLGTGKILNTIKDKLDGNVMLIFQAGEELLPGGAKEIIKSGIFDKYKPEWIGAIHCDPSIETGKVGFRKGMYMASGDEIFLTIKGEGGHAAMPHKTADTILIAAEILIALQQINSRHCPPSIPSVLTFGKIIGEGAVNIIPKEVKLEGTFRTMNEEWRAKAKKLIKKIAKSIAENHGAECDVNIIDGYPYLENDIEYTQHLKKIAEKSIGRENIIDLDIRMTTEDFSYYSQIMKSTFFRLGVGEKGKEMPALHSSKFKANEEALEGATSLLSEICISLL